VTFLSKYQLGELILEGEARTSKARELSSGREVLVHELPTGADRGRGTDLLRMIHRYLRTLPPKVRNPILELGEHEGRMYLVTDAIPGFHSLRNWLEGSLTGIASEPETLDKTRLSVAPAARSASSSPGDATVVVPAPADAAPARTQVIKVAPGEWVLTSSPAPPPVATEAADVTIGEPIPTIRSAAPIPLQQPVQQPGSATAFVESPARSSGSEPWRTASDDVTMVGLPPADTAAVLLDRTMVAPLGSAPASAPGTTAQQAAPGTGSFEATQVMPSPVDAGIGGANKEIGVSADENLPRPWTILDTAGAKPSPPPPAGGELTMVLGVSQDALVSERQAPPARPSGKAAVPPPGEFTRLMQAAPAATSGAPSGISQSSEGPSSGDFTRMLDGALSPTRPDDRGQRVGSGAFGDDPQLAGFTSLIRGSSAQSPTGLSSELPAGLGTRPAGEFTQIFGASGTPGPLSFGQNASAGGYTNKPEPGEFTQIFGRQAQGAPGGEASSGRFEPGAGAGPLSVQKPGGAPLPSAQQADAAPSGGQKAAALPALKPPEAPAPGKSAKATSPAAAPKLPSPPSVPLDKLPTTPAMAAPVKPAMPAAPKLPAPPKIPAPPAPPALKPNASAAAAKVAKPHRSYLTLVLILGGIFVVATAMILYFALAGH
jgi:hypothetical protein